MFSASLGSVSGRSGQAALRRAARFLARAAVAGGVSLAASLVGAQPQLVDLGPGPGGATSGALAISGNGLAVAAEYTTGTTPHPAVWRHASGMIDLGGLPGATGGSAFGISADGSVVVGRSSVGSNDRAFRWTAAGGMRDLGVLPGGAQFTAVGTSADGQLVCGFGFIGAQAHAFRWTPLGGIQDLGFLPGSDTAIAYAVSADGSTIVGVSGVPFRWSDSLGMEALDTSAGEAHGVSASGDVVVGHTTEAMTLRTHAFRWSQSSGFVQIAEGPAIVSSSASCCSADGSVLGLNTRLAASIAAATWTATDGVVDVRDQLAALGVNVAGWELWEVNGMTPDGSTLVGRGRHNGAIRAWMARGLPRSCLPRIVSQPNPVNVLAGASASFALGATSASPLTYRWRRNGSDLSDGPTAFGSSVSGSTSAVLTVSDVTASDAGAYTCVVSTACGSITTLNASLGLLTPCGTAVEQLLVGSVCAGGGQDCDNTLTFTRETCGSLGIEYTTLATHCSNVGMRVFVDGVPAALIAPLPPATSSGQIDLGPVSPGVHSLTLEAFGEESGCNAGFLESWGGTLALTTCSSAATVAAPADARACGSRTAIFAVSPGGTGPFTYQWELEEPPFSGVWVTALDGDDPGTGTLLGTGSATLVVTGTPNNAAARVRCTVTNSCSVATSGPARLSVCIADFNCSGAVGVQDIFDFLASYFAQDPLADINLSGAVSVQDIFDYLAAYFAGCD